MKFAKYFHYFLLLTFYCLLFAMPVHAQVGAPPSAAPAPAPIPNPQNGLNILVSPPIISLNTEPNVPISSKFKIKNNNTETEALQLSIMKFVPDATGTKPQLAELSPSDVFPQWLNFSESKFVMDPKSWKNIDFTFHPTDNAAPSYYFAIIINRQDVAKVEGKTVLSGAASVLCLVQVNSSRVYHQLDLQQLTSKGLDFNTKNIYEFLPVNFTVTLQNSGNVHELAYGDIFIDWVSGNQSDVGLLNVNPDKSFILPQSTRSFNSSWTDGFPVWEEIKDAEGNTVMDKNNQPKHKLTWDFSKLTSFRIGKFKAILLMVYNDGVRDIPLEAETSFWVIPWRILLALLILLILITIGLKRTIQSIWDKTQATRQSIKYRATHPPKPMSH